MAGGGFLELKVGGLDFVGVSGNDKEKVKTGGRKQNAQKVAARRERRAEEVHGRNERGFTAEEEQGEEAGKGGTP